MSSTLQNTAPPTTLLELDAEVFRQKFSRQPFLIKHHLCDHPLFRMDRLLELARSLPPCHIEYNAGNIPLSLDPSLTPANGLSAEQTIERIENCQSWLVLKYVDTDPAYRELLEHCLEEIRPHSEPIVPGMCKPESFIFISSPGSVTPYHMDPEHNFLLQIRGTKTVRQFDRCVVTQEQFEKFYLGAHRNMPFQEEFLAHSWEFDLPAGHGLHFPSTFPHWVQNGSGVSISYSVTFRTPDLERLALIHNANASLRRWGFRPSPVGRSAWKDNLKYLAQRTLRRLRRLLGKRS